MESLDEKIKRFLAVSSGYGDGSGSGSGYGSGSGSGSGSGYGSGSGSSYGDGYGYGSSYGYGDGYGDGDGSGYGYGDGIIKEYNHRQVYNIDGVPTLIFYVHGNCAKGAILKKDNTVQACYISKVCDCFAHGETLEIAVRDARGKAFQNMSEEKRVEAFLAEHSDREKRYSYDNLFRWHNLLTDSCEMGRKEFCKECGITEADTFTLKEFCTLTRNQYGGDVIKLLEKKLED